MEILHFSMKSAHLNSIEKFYVYKQTMSDNQLNDKHTVTYNKIFDTLLKKLN
jgi:hypothetical protein